MPAADDPMRSADQGRSGVTLWQYMFVGYALRYLTSVSVGKRIQPEGNRQKGVLDYCKTLQEAMERFRLQTSYERYGRDLSVLIAEVEDRLRQQADAKFDAELVSRIRGLATNLYSAFLDEADKRRAFPVLPAYEIDVDTLLRSPYDWFSVTIGELPLKADVYLEDFQEAARCFAVGFTLSAIVFALRGTEGFFREYYKLITGRSPFRQQADGTVVGRDWCDLEGELLEGQSNCPEALISILPILRQKRNETMYTVDREPELWGSEAANDVLKMCQAAVLQMVIHLEQHLGY